MVLPPPLHSAPPNTGPFITEHGRGHAVQANLHHESRMASPNPQEQQREPQVAVAPLNTVDARDVNLDTREPV